MLPARLRTLQLEERLGGLKVKLPDMSGPIRGPGRLYSTLEPPTRSWTSIGPSYLKISASVEMWLKSKG